MYRIINTFLTLKPDMDISNVPEFYKLFRSSVLEVSFQGYVKQYCTSNACDTN